jgi:hypothetical protein
MKTLVNCKPSEFMAQTNLIRKSIAKWLNDTDIINIRKRLPHREIAAIDATDEERLNVEIRNKEAAQRQIKENLVAILDAVLETHGDETLEVLALCCFVDPKNVDDYTVSEYLSAFNSIINDENVLDFFTSLARLDRINILNA